MHRTSAFTFRRTPSLAVKRRNKRKGDNIFGGGQRGGGAFASNLSQGQKQSQTFQSQMTSAEESEAFKRVENIIDREIIAFIQASYGLQQRLRTGSAIRSTIDGWIKDLDQYFSILEDQDKKRSNNPVNTGLLAALGGLMRTLDVVSSEMNDQEVTLIFTVPSLRTSFLDALARSAGAVKSLFAKRIDMEKIDTDQKNRIEQTIVYYSEMAKAFRKLNKKYVELVEGIESEVEKGEKEKKVDKKKVQELESSLDGVVSQALSMLENVRDKKEESAEGFELWQEVLSEVDKGESKSADQTRDINTIRREAFGSDLLPSIKPDKPINKQNPRLPEYMQGDSGSTPFGTPLVSHRQPRGESAPQLEVVSNVDPEDLQDLQEELPKLTDAQIIELSYKGVDDDSIRFAVDGLRVLIKLTEQMGADGKKGAVPYAIDQFSDISENCRMAKVEIESAKLTMSLTQPNKPVVDFEVEMMDAMRNVISHAKAIDAIFKDMHPRQEIKWIIQEYVKSPNYGQVYDRFKQNFVKNKIMDIDIQFFQFGYPSPVTSEAEVEDASDMDQRALVREFPISLGNYVRRIDLHVLSKISDGFEAILSMVEELISKLIAVQATIKGENSVLSTLHSRFMGDHFETLSEYGDNFQKKNSHADAILEMISDRLGRGNLIATTYRGANNHDWTRYGVRAFNLERKIKSLALKYAYKMYLLDMAR